MPDGDGSDRHDLSTPPGDAPDSLEAVLKRVVSAPPTLPVLAPGSVIAERYEIQRLLGAGGMGAVYSRATERWTATWP